MGRFEEMLHRTQDPVADIGPHLRRGTERELEPAPSSGMARPFVQTALTNAVIAGINLITGLALARILGPDKRGILAAVINWPMILATFGTVGLTEAAAYYTAKRPARARQYYANTLRICVPVSILLGAIGWFAMPLLLDAQSSSTVTTSRWLLLLCPFATVVAVSEGTLRGQKRVGAWNLYRVLWPFAWLLTVAAAAIVGTSSPVFLAAGFAVTRSVAAIPVVFWFLTTLPGPMRQSRRVRRSLIRYGAPGFFTLLPSVMNSRLDQLLLAGLVSSEVLGLYVVSVAWASIATLPAMSLAGLVLPRLASIESDELRRQSFAESSRVGAALAVATAIPVWAATPIVLPFLFGGSFREAIPTASVLILAAIATSWNLVMVDGARGLGSPKTVLWAEGAGLVATVIALALLLGRFDLLGAAIASVIGYGVTSLVLLRYARRTSGLSSRQLLVPTRADLATLSPSALRQRITAGRPGAPDGV